MVLGVTSLELVICGGRFDRGVFGAQVELEIGRRRQR